MLFRSISAASYACILRVLLCPQFDVMCPFLLNLIGTTNTSLHLYPHPYLHLHSHRCPWNRLHLPISLPLGISTWEHNNRYSRLCEKCSKCSGRSTHSRRGRSMAFDVRSLFERVIPASPILLPIPTILPQSRLVSRSAPYSHQHPETSKRA